MLQGHLRRGGRPAPDQPPATNELPPAEERSAQPSDEGATGEAGVTRGKATGSPAKVATRRNLEGSEQGPV